MIVSATISIAGILISAIASSSLNFSHQARDSSERSVPPSMPVRGSPRAGRSSRGVAIDTNSAMRLRRWLCVGVSADASAMPARSAQASTTPIAVYGEAMMRSNWVRWNVVGIGICGERRRHVVALRDTRQARARVTLHDDRLASALRRTGSGRGTGRRAALRACGTARTSSDGFSASA